MPGVRIRGEGVAACCCAHLLGAPMEVAERARVPALIVGEPTQRLIADVFGRDDIFAGLPRIERRVVAWGAETVTVPHRAVVISEQELAARLRPEIASENIDAEWMICATRPLPVQSVEHHFGSRTASASQVVVS